MGAAISGHWDLRDTGTTREYNTLARSLGCSGGSRVVRGFNPPPRLFVFACQYMKIPEDLDPTPPGDITMGLYFDELII